MKKNKITTKSTAIATGVFKRRTWPWLLILAGVLCLLAPVALYAKEYFIDKCSSCGSFMQCLASHASTLTIATAVCLAICVLAILFFIFPKRSFVLTACKIVSKKGRKEKRIPLSAITRIDTFGKYGIVAFTGKKKVKFKNLKNKKELYDALLSCIQKNAEAVKEVETISPTNQKAPAISDYAKGKILYFRNLLNVGAITNEQFADYVEKVLETM